MNIKLEKKHIQWGITAFLVIAASVCIFLLASHIGGIFAGIANIFSILTPIIYGACIAYILNPIMRFFEETLVLKTICTWLQLAPSKKAMKYIRLGCTVLALLFMFACIYALVALLVPQLLYSVSSLANSLPRYIRTIRQFVVKLFANNPEMESSVVNSLESITQTIQNWINNSFVPKINDFMTTFSSQIIDLLGVVKNFLIGSIISIYFLIGKEMFIARGKRLIYAVLGSAEMANNVLRDLRYINKTFGGFLLGKIIDSAIIGVICYICTSILSMPYALLISVVIGITNIIPFFGPFIGAIPCALLIFLVSPVKCLYFIIFIIILQQIDGNLIGPKILSNSTGLSSFMVVVAILVGGGLFGFVGLIIGVPLFAVLTQLCSNLINDRLKKNDLPTDVDMYRRMDRIDPETLEPTLKEEDEHLKLFHYGVKGRKLEDPDTDDEVLPLYRIKKSRRHIINDVADMVADFSKKALDSKDQKDGSYVVIEEILSETDQDEETLFEQLSEMTEDDNN